MKKLALIFIAITFFANTHTLPAEKGRSLLEKVLNKDLPGGVVSRAAKTKTSNSKDIRSCTKEEIGGRSLLEKALGKDLPGGNARKKCTSTGEVVKVKTKKKVKACAEIGGRSLLEKALGKDLPGGNARKNIKKKCSPSSEQVKMRTNKKNKKYFSNNETGQNISFYTGTFDTIDKEGDDQTSLAGIEHKNEDLFRNTLIGRFSPTTGAFVTGKSSIYFYSGIEADYNLGRVSISPSFAPGYYEAGNGKNLGSALEFKSQIKIGLDLFKDSNLGYSYSHISNNDWGDVNPGTDNQSLSFSKKF